MSSQFWLRVEKLNRIWYVAHQGSLLLILKLIETPVAHFWSERWQGMDANWCSLSKYSLRDALILVFDGQAIGMHLDWPIYICTRDICQIQLENCEKEKQTNKQCSWSRRPLKYQRIQTEHFFTTDSRKRISLELKRMLLAIKLPELLRINDKCRKLNSTIFKFSLFKDDAPSAAKLNKSMMNTAKLDKECGQTLVWKAECSLAWIPKMHLRMRPPPILEKRSIVAKSGKKCISNKMLGCFLFQGKGVSLV